jgi:hypothetical protein
MIKKICLIIIFIYTLVAVGAVINNRKTLINYLTNQNLLPKPEKLTELYFQEHLTLPSKVSTNKQYSFAFTINNMEHKDMDYPYEIYILQDGKKHNLNKNAVSVKDNEAVTIQQSFILSEPINRAKVVVELTNQKSIALGEPVPSGEVGINNAENTQQIDFWIEKQ